MTETVDIRLGKRAVADVLAGRPWVFRSGVELTSEGELLPPGSIVRLTDTRGKYLATAAFNPKTELCARVFTTNAKEEVNAAFFEKRLARALKKREELFSEPYYRLVHSDGDFLSGLVIDRYGDVLVCQVTSAFMFLLKDTWLAVLQKMLPEIKGMLIDHSDSYAAREGIKRGQETVGDVPDVVKIIENGCVYFADLKEGQKTGWFFDQRANRKYMAQFAKGKKMLDAYCHSGGFGVLAALNGAESVTFVDRSELALSLAKKAAKENGVLPKCTFYQSEVYEDAGKRGVSGEKFDVVMVDPPAFIKQKKHKIQGLKGYEKLVKLTAPLATKGGVYCLTSCSHHAPAQELRRVMERTFTECGINHRLLHHTGADSDHPTHPKLPETAYIKFFVYNFS